MILKKAQTATEYLVILAVVIVIALVAVGVLGGIPGVGKSADSRAEQAYWSGTKIGITGWAVDEAGNITLGIKNNEQRTVQVSSISVDGQEVLSTDTVLNIGAKRTITGLLSSVGNENDPYSYNVSITYSDVETNTTYVIQGTEKISGIFASVSGQGNGTTCVDSDCIPYLCYNSTACYTSCTSNSNCYNSSYVCSTYLSQCQLIVYGGSCNANKIAICHLPGVDDDDMCVNINQLQGHLDHGDFLGAC